MPLGRYWVALSRWSMASRVVGVQMHERDIQHSLLMSTLWQWPDRLIAADPGLERLRFAGRITLPVDIALGLEVALAHLSGQSFSAC